MYAVANYDMTCFNGEQYLQSPLLCLTRSRRLFTKFLAKDNYTLDNLNNFIEVSDGGFKMLIFKNENGYRKSEGVNSRTAELYMF